jgi:hypothetical protein
VHVDAGRNRSFDERLAHAVLAEDNQRDRPLDARAATRFFSDEIIWGFRKRRLAHVSSLNPNLERIPLDGPGPMGKYLLMDGITHSNGNQHLRRCPAFPVSFTPAWSMLAEPRSIVDISVDDCR